MVEFLIQLSGSRIRFGFRDEPPGVLSTDQPGLTVNSKIPIKGLGNWWSGFCHPTSVLGLLTSVPSPPSPAGPGGADHAGRIAQLMFEDRRFHVFVEGVAAHLFQPQGVEFVDVGYPAAQHHRIGIQNGDQATQAAAEIVQKLLESGSAVGFAVAGTRR
jgi:hypothetical protein